MTLFWEGKFRWCRRGEEYVLDGKKWWTTGACDPRCAVAVFMGKSDTSAATYRQQSMVLVPMSSPGALPLLHTGLRLAPRSETGTQSPLCSGLLLTRGRRLTDPVCLMECHRIYI